MSGLLDDFWVRDKTFSCIFVVLNGGVDLHRSYSLDGGLNTENVIREGWLVQDLGPSGLPLIAFCMLLGSLPNFDNGQEYMDVRMIFGYAFMVSGSGFFAMPHSNVCP